MKRSRLRISYKNYFRYSFTLLLLIFLLYPSALTAQALTCTGTLCPASIVDDIDALGDLLKKNYGRDLARGFGRAHTISNIALTPQISNLKLGIFTLGAQLGMGREKEETEFEDTAAGSNIKKPDFNGFFAQYFVYGGVNLGFIFSLLTSSDILDSIDIYYGSGDVKINHPVSISIDTLEYTARSTYYGIRYQLINPIGIFIVGWQGLSLHVGRVASKGSIKLEDEDDDPDERFGIGDFNWKAENEIEFTTSAKTSIIELKTAFQVLFLYASIGAGLAYNTIDTRFTFNRSGNLYTGSSQIDALLTADFTNRYDTQVSRMYYGRMGLEFSFIPLTRLGLEYIYNSDELSAFSIGVRIDI